MGIHDGLFSNKLRKSAGDVTFTTWKGIAVFKKRVREVRNPRTNAQMIQRARMKALSELGSLAIQAIRYGFKKFATKKSEYNVFSSENIAEVTGFPDLTSDVNFPNLIFSKGNLQGIDGLSAPNIAGDDVTVTWTAPGAGDADENHEVILLAIRTNRAATADTVPLVAKTVGTATAVIPDVQAGDTIEVYAFARNPLNGEVSNTFYAGQVTA